MPQHPTPPGNRFDFANDGTDVLVKFDTETEHQTLSPAAVAGLGGVNRTTEITKTLNGSTTPGAAGFMRLRFIFPEPRQILGMRWSGWSDYGSLMTLAARYSLNATATAWDGDWNAMNPSGGVARNTPSIDVFRGDIAAMTLEGVRGIEVAVRNDRASTATYTGRIADVHIYGARNPTGDHLAFWHPTVDQPLPGGSLDFGDVVRGVPTPGKAFRVKNTSTSKTATGVTVAYGDLDGVAVGGDSGQVSADGITWLPAAPVADLAPGAISDVRHLRLAPGLNRPINSATIGRVRAAVNSWTG